jgi:TonB-dependent receptor
MKNLSRRVGRLIQSFMIQSDSRLSSRALLLSGFVFILVAQSLVFGGTIKGTIFDKDTKETLPAANILIEGTSLGTAADLKGSYVISSVPAGKYTLLVSFVGYEKESAEITVPEDGTVENNFELRSVAVQGKQVVITAQLLGQIQAINQQIASNTITNVVSKARILELPDDNASTALSRLPGVSLMNGDQVVIRGIQAKLNTVLINGIEIPSTSMTDRATSLGFISSNLLSGIEVIKAITPDMDANAVGGVVNLRLREAPVGLHYDIFSQGNYNTLDRTKDNYKVWGSVSQRFLGDKLGVFIQGNADRSDQGQDRGTATFGMLGGYEKEPYGLAPYKMNSFVFQDQENIYTNYGGSLILDYQLPKGKIILQNTLTHNINDNTAYRLDMNLAGNDVTYSISRDKYERDLMINALQTEYNFGPLKSELSLSHSYTSKGTLDRYGDPGNFFGFNNDKDSHPFGLDANGNTITYALAGEKLTLKDVYNIKPVPEDAELANVGGWIVANDEAFEQHVYDSKLDFTLPVNFTKSISSTIKFGGKYKSSERENDVESKFNGSGDPDYYYGTTNFFPGHPNLSITNEVLFSDLRASSYSRGENFLNGDYPFIWAYDRDLMDRYMKASASGWENSRHNPYSDRNDFNGTETFSAGYLMGDVNIGSRLSLIGGLRYEHYNMDYKGAMVYCTHSVYGYGVTWDTLNTVNRNDENLFPNAQLRYKVTDWADFRLAYTQGISRPDYNAIMPSVYFEPGGYTIAGNTKLKPTIATNYDANVSLYSNKIGLFTLGGFYKVLDDVFYQGTIYYQNLGLYNISFPGDDFWEGAMGAQGPDPSLTINCFINNPNPAYIKGLEAEWQTNFWYLPHPLNSMVLNINYTRIWSEMDYQQIRNETIMEGSPRPKPKYVTTDTIRTARLVYQGDHVLNVALGADYKGFSGRISFNLQGDVITSVGNRPEADQFTGNIYRWDFTLQQKLPVKGFSVAFNGTNVFNNPVYTYQKFRRNGSEEILKNEQSVAYSPRIFQVNLRYSH